MFKWSQNVCKFSAFSLKFLKFFSITKTFFLTVGQNNFGNKSFLHFTFYVSQVLWHRYFKCSWVIKLVKSSWLSKVQNICLFFSSRSLKPREKSISFAQFVYSLREVCLLFNLWMMKFAIGCLNQVDIKRRSLTWYTVRIIAPFSWRWSRIKIFWHNCEFYHWKVNTLSPKNIKTEQS